MVKNKGAKKGRRRNTHWWQKIKLYKL